METIALDPWLAHLDAHLALAREGSDPEGVHQVRVALGRLDQWLAAGGWRVLRDDVRWLRRGAGRVRDLDVQLGAEPPPAWARILEQERRRARSEFLERLDDPRAGALFEALGLLPPLAARRLEQRLRSWTARVVRRGKAMEECPGDLERYHALRRAVRRLRYALEWTGRGTRPIKDLQDALGELNDGAVTVALLEELDRDNELAEFLQHQRAEVERLRERALAAWQAGSFTGEDT